MRQALENFAETADGLDLKWVQEMKDTVGYQKGKDGGDSDPDK